jgi:hypothetical protein
MGKENDIIIPRQPKEKFTSDKIFGQELMILAKKKKNYENHLNNLSSELQSKFIEFSKQYKMKLS